MITETVQYLAYQGQGRTQRRDAKPAWADPVPVQAGVDVPVSSEPRDGTVQRVRADFVIYAEPGFRCEPRDRFIVRDYLCAVEGVGEPVANVFTGTPFRTEINLRRING